MRQGKAQSPAEDQGHTDGHGDVETQVEHGGLPKAQHGRQHTRASHDPQSHATASATAIQEPHVTTIWRLLRGMGVPADDVGEATLLSFKRALAQRAREPDTAHRASDHTFDGVPLAHVVDPTLAAAYREARDQWQPMLEQPAGAASGSTIRFHAEMLVLELLGSLDEPKRAGLLLADMEGFSTPEIAALTGERLDLVYEDLHRARKAFARALGRHERSQASVAPETQARQLLDLSRTRFSPDAMALAALRDALSAVSASADPIHEP